MIHLGIWIGSFVLIILLFAQPIPAQYKSIKSEDVRISRLKLYEGIDQAIHGYWETASQKFGEALDHNHQNQEARLCHWITFDIIDGRLSESDGEDLFFAIEAWMYADYDKAKLIFENICETKKDYALIYLFKGLNNVSIEDFSKAEIELNKVIELEPHISFAFIKRGQLYGRQRKYDLAIRDFNRAIEIDTLSYLAYYERGTIYQAINAYENSVDDYERAFYLFPALKQTLHMSLKICEGYNNLGMIYLKNKNYKAALNNFNDAINWNALFSEPYLNRGITYRNMGHFDAAISDFNYVLELDSVKANAYFNLALTYEEIGNLDKSMSYLEMIKDSDPHRIESYQKRGEIYYNRRQFNQASSMFEKVLSIDDKNYWGYYWVALSYDAEKKYREAIRAYEIFIKTAPQEFYDQKVKMYERAERLKRWMNRDKP